MNKRNLLKAMLAACIAPLVPSFASAKPVLDENSYIILYNKIGLPFKVTPEMVEDLLAVHNIRIHTLVPTLYGTTFTIKKRVVGSGIKDRYGNVRVGLMFTLTTNDSRDNPQRWMLSEYPMLIV